MLNQSTRRIDAEKIRQEFIKSKRLEILTRPIYPRIAPTSPTPPKQAS